jgi:hypothetical protein
MDSLEAARAAQASSQASLNAVREEDLRKQRIAIQIVRDVSSLWPEERPSTRNTMADL